MAEKHFASFDSDHKAAMVVSHERSGTHFTMNALAGCFGYVSKPWVDLDHTEININFHHAPSMEKVFDFIIEKRCASTVKSHHSAEFFESVLSRIEGKMEVVYVVRNPVDVMVSFWRFLHTWNWVEGPLAATAAGFAESAPMGRLMRYQWRQHETMLHRWADHAEGWLNAAAAHPNVHVVRYEDMVSDFPGAMRGLADAMELPLRSDSPPGRESNVVQKGKRPFDPAPGADDRDAVRTVAKARLGPRLETLGYPL